ncbi:hypothetical protein FHX74_002534 [Friedmanniella endophytica]|uniref:Uncharacterized protein n=1 Tax=Microlunatus kandeliicorticis TaxID=1759536 RepID=A0A7W3ITE1_9ACTN|nr:hypothetical protein [Microlunatus kandeliicorticis]MBA8794906.1 hypothetical protein [Microlunatus kandeliicorticis]
MTDQHSTGVAGPDLLADLVAAVRRRWRQLTTRPAPDYQTPPSRLDPQAWRVHRQERVLDLLEATRHRIGETGWVAGGWMASTRSGSSTTAGLGEVRALLARPGGAGAACLVGTMLLLADDQDTAHTHEDVWQATDALYESVHERAGHTGWPAGHVWSPADRRHHLRVLTAWNDAPGRHVGDVVDLLNRSISRTIAACVS